jgi:hypothetical protein
MNPSPDAKAAMNPSPDAKAAMQREIEQLAGVRK